MALRTLGASSRRSPPVLRAAEEAPGSTPAAQTSTSPSGEGDEFRGETAAAQNRSFSQFPDQARELAFQIRELALQIGQLKDKLADQSAQQSERMARLESSLGTFGALIAFLVTAVPVALMFLQKK